MNKSILGPNEIRHYQNSLGNYVSGSLDPRDMLTTDGVFSDTFGTDGANRAPGPVTDETTDILPTEPEPAIRAVSSPSDWRIRNVVSGRKISGTTSMHALMRAFPEPTDVWVSYKAATDYSVVSLRRV